MKILVCITHVPDTTAKISFTEQDTKFNSSNVPFIIGPYDEYALARAVEIRESMGGSLTVLNVGEAETEPTLRKALAIGADDAIRIDAQPLDAWFVATQIAHVAQQNSYDMILMGRESIDFNGSCVHGMVAELLGWPSINPVMHLQIEGNSALLTKEIEGGKEKLKVDFPFVAGCQEPIAEWKIPNMRGIMSARTKPLAVLPPQNIDSKTTLVQYALPPTKSGCKMIDASTPEKLLELLRTEAKAL